MKKNLIKLLVGLIVSVFWLNTKAEVTFSGQASPPAAKLALWYRTPATNWMTSALPIGNGRIGAMVFGGVAQEHIQFNDKTLWTGSKTIRGAYQNFGDLYFDFPGLTTASNYRRELDLESGVSRVTYTIGAVTYTREYFCSYPDNAIVMRFTSTGSANLNFDVSMVDAHNGTMSTSGNRITMGGTLTLLSYEGQVTVNNDGGTLSTNGNKISVSGANSVTVIFAGGTNYDPTSSTYLGSTAAQLHTSISSQSDAAATKAYSTLYNNHINDYQPLFSRVSLNLNDSKPTIPTNELQANYNNGVYNSFLDILYFQYGRYLMLGSARGIALPSNLQGLWNNSNTPPWEADIHSNINVQMNYWPAEIANLSECHSTFNDYIYNEAMVQSSWRNMASSTGNSGWTMKTQNNIFGYSDWEWNQPANAWYSMHLWQHYAFTLDANYLANKAYPAMKSACDFWISRLITAPDGKLVAPNEWSPEHGTREDGVAYAQQLIWDLFTNTIKASEALNIDADYRTTLQTKLANLDNGLAIGTWGQIKEWRIQGDDQTDTHRHLSHLMALYPGKTISPLIDQNYSNAAKISLTARGDVGPGWSRAWKISAWARLLDGNHAHALVKNALQNTTTITNDGGVNGGAYENLLDAHPPFQIDGNFGATAGIVEMLVQSHLGKIQLLPAVPAAWPMGSVSGIKTMNNFTVGLNWNNDNPTSATIYSGSGKDCVVYYTGVSSATLKDNDGNIVPFTINNTNEIQFQTIIGKTYTLSNINFHVSTIQNAIKDDVYEIVSRRSGKAVSVVNDAATDGSAIEQRTYSGSDSQQWILNNIGFGLVKLTNKASGKVIQIADNSTSNGAALQLGTYNSAGNQHYTLTPTDNGFFRITPLKSSDKGVDVDGGSSADGATLIQWSYGGGTNQQWNFIKTSNAIEDGIYEIVSRRSGKAVSVVNDAATDGSAIEQRTYSGSDSQQWILNNMGSGLVKLTNKASGKVIQIADNSTSNGAALQLGTYNSAGNQHYTLTATDNGFFRITPLNNSDKGVDVNNGSSADGATLIQWSYGGGTNQQWNFILTGTLPVTLIDYGVKLQNDGNVVVKWSTAAETNNDYFLVERSTDGKVFTLIDKVLSKGSNSIYSLIDKNPYPGINYYRLIQFDKNGDNKNLGIKSVRLELFADNSTLYPNPLTNNTLFLKLPNENKDKILVEVSDLIGNKIFSKTISKNQEGAFELKFDSKPLPGVYIVRTMDRNIVRKLLVQ